MARVALTGGTGFLGSNVAEVLMDAGHEVLVVTRATPAMEVPWSYAVVDTSDSAALEEVLTGCDAVTQGLYTPLGQGDVDVKDITSTLISQGYTGWFVLEQDNVMRQEPDSGGGPMGDAKASVEFLRAVAAEAEG